MPAHETFNRQTIALDGEHFSDCEFNACRLVYAGGEVPGLDRCKFTDCEWRFEAAAADTLAYLKLMWLAGAKPAVQSVIKDVTVVPR